MAHLDLEHNIQNDPSTSFWLHEQLRRTKERDPVDALNDAETLVSVLKNRLKKLEVTNTEPNDLQDSIFRD
jgi:hypothetical protein